MEEGAYGGGKAGAPFDPLSFVQRPQVILRAVTWVRKNAFVVWVESGHAQWPGGDGGTREPNRPVLIFV